MSDTSGLDEHDVSVEKEIDQLIGYALSIDIVGAAKVNAQKAKVKALIEADYIPRDTVLEIIGQTNSFESENTGRVWIDPDDLIRRLTAPLSKGGEK